VQQGQFALHFDPVGDVLAAAESCEAAVFLETYGNTAQQWRDEYGPYDPASVFITILEPAGDAVASCRLILPSSIGLKSLVDTERAPWFVRANDCAAAAGMSPAETCDVATVAVRRGTAAAGLLAAALYYGIVAATKANLFRWLVMIIDARARRLLSMLNLEGQVLPGTMAAPYLGSSVSIPIWADVPRLLEAQRERNLDAHLMIDAGIGLDAITIPAAADFVVKPRGLNPATDFVPRVVDRADDRSSCSLR
jgi:hypothetical protein